MEKIIQAWKEFAEFFLLHVSAHTSLFISLFAVILFIAISSFFISLEKNIKISYALVTSMLAVLSLSLFVIFGTGIICKSNHWCVNYLII